MPDIGDIVQAHDLGMVGARKYVWTECPCCHLQRWTAIRTMERGTNRRCQPCVREALKRSFKIGRALGP